MCKPRHVEVTITLPVRESWQRKVWRIAKACGLLPGEAHIRRQLIRAAMLGERDLWPLHYVWRVVRQEADGRACYG